MKSDILPGSIWEHRNGDIYAVILLANLNATRTGEYPVTIVYTGADGQVWSRPLSRWNRSMTEVMED